MSFQRVHQSKADNLHTSSSAFPSQRPLAIQAQQDSSRPPVPQDVESMDDFWVKKLAQASHVDRHPSTIPVHAENLEATPIPSQAAIQTHRASSPLQAAQSILPPAQNRETGWIQRMALPVPHADSRPPLQPKLIQPKLTIG